MTCSDTSTGHIFSIKITMLLDYNSYNITYFFEATKCVES
jgi:hypothetical protein